MITTPQTRVAINSMDLVSSLVRRGVHPNKSRRDDPFPDVPSEHLASFVRGYFDGDGCISLKSDGYASLTLVGTKAFLEGLEAAVRTALDLRQKQVREASCKSGLRYLTWSRRSELERICRWMYADVSGISMSRKRDKWDRFLEQKI